MAASQTKAEQRRPSFPNLPLAQARRPSLPAVQFSALSAESSLAVSQVRRPSAPAVSLALAQADGENAEGVPPRVPTTSSIRHSHQRRPSAVARERRNPVLPEPLTSSSKVHTATLEEVPTVEDLKGWLGERHLDTEGWGKNGSKDVSKLWKEIKNKEAGLEVWKKSETGELQVVRVTHVLRAKVCSAQSRERGIFLFNTWQQFASGKKRTRNGLLSEKLSVAEMPLEDHIDEVCKRAVTTEEMRFVVDAAFQVAPGWPLPKFDAEAKCPITVEQTYFVDHTMEVELSKSFPGLLTLYHLYTVEIVCDGLPCVDFNTLEYQDEEEDGTRPLKYVHAWIWLEWSKIQRYLFEGSELKEKKTKGSFKDVFALKVWLNQFEIQLEPSRDEDKVMEDLFEMLEREETQLELWGRHNGAPLLMQVAHMLQIRVVSSDPRLQNKFLLRTWQQHSGEPNHRNELLMSTLSVNKVPFDKNRFVDATREVVRTQLSHLTEAHFRLEPGNLPTKQKYPASEVKVILHEFTDHHFRTEESPDFRGLYVMNHLYNMEVLCEGLPVAGFTALDFDSAQGPVASGWKWVNLHAVMDILQRQARVAERTRAVMQEEHQSRMASARSVTDELWESLNTFLTSSGPDRDEEELHEAKRLVTELQGELEEEYYDEDAFSRQIYSDSHLPPSMISKMALKTIAVEEYLEEAYQENIVRTAALQERRSSLAGENMDGGGGSQYDSASNSGPLARKSSTLTSRVDIGRQPVESDLQAPALSDAASMESRGKMVQAQVLKSDSLKATEAEAACSLCVCDCEYHGGDKRSSRSAGSIHSAVVTTSPPSAVPRVAGRPTTALYAGLVVILLAAIQVGVGLWLLLEVDGTGTRNTVLVLALVFSACLIGTCTVLALWARRSVSAVVPAAWDVS